MKPGDTLPDLEYSYHGGQWWRTAYNTSDADWIDLGVAPTPRTTWQCFWYHVGHGLMMQYPLWAILRFAWQHRQSFFEDAPDMPDATLEIGRVKPRIVRISRRL